MRKQERVWWERKWEKNVFFLITFFLITKNKNQNDVILAHLMEVDNWGLTKYQIDNNWKLEDLNDKTES